MSKYIWGSTTNFYDIFEAKSLWGEDLKIIARCDKSAESLPDFDTRPFDALGAHRTSRGMSWAQVAREFSEQSAILNQCRGGHPMGPPRLRGWPRGKHDAVRRARRTPPGTSDDLAPGRPSPALHAQSADRPQAGRYATNMKLAMRITQWLERSVADFIHAAEW